MTANDATGTPAGTLVVSARVLSRGAARLMHHGEMTPAQLVLRGDKRHGAALDLMENVAGALPSSFEDLAAGVRVPRMGGSALLRAAAQAMQLGFVVTRIEFDGHGPRTLRDPGVEEEASEETLRLLRSVGAQDAEGFLDHVYENFLVTGVQFYSDATRAVTLRRDGVILGKDTRHLWVFVRNVLETIVT